MSEIRPDIILDKMVIKKMVQNHIKENDSNKIEFHTKKILPFNLISFNKNSRGVYVRYEVIIKESRAFEHIIQESVLFDYDEYKINYRDIKLRSIGIGQSLGDKIRGRLNEYLEFNSDELFPLGGLVRIFGGAIRDSISDRGIHDVDILCGSLAHDYIENVLKEHGYSFIEALAPKDLSSIYHDIKIINEPHCWVKGSKIVQIIRPVAKHNDEFYEQSFKELIRNVDISCCGVSYDGDRLYENYQNAVSHCRSGVFVVNKDAKMYSRNRIEHRRVKLNGRGWIEIKDTTQEQRDVKIDKLLNEDNLDFVPEYRSNLYYSNEKTFDNDDWIWGEF